jgi:outer membrane protein insertion porin family
MFKQIIIIILFYNFWLVAQSYELQSIEFEGNSELSSSELSEAIYSTETPWWFWKFLNSFTPLGSEPVYFDSTNIQLDLEALEAFYNSQGFFEAEFSHEFTVDTSELEVTLKYIISEGDASVYGNSKIFGLNNIPEYIALDIYDEMSIDTTERFLQSTIEQKTEQSVDILLNNGYMLAKFDSTVILRDTALNKAHLIVYFTSGKRYIIDTLLVEKTGDGADLVSEQLVREITDISPGEFYSLEKIRRSQVRLFRTGLFNSVQLNGAVEDTANSRVPLRLKGNIGRMNELAPEIIINNQQNAFNVGLGANYIRKNFLGDARKLTIRFSFGLQDFFKADFDNLINRFSFRDTTLLGYVDSRIIIEQPNLFNEPIYGTWENYAKIDKQRRYNLTTFGTKFTFEFELPQFTFINFLSTSYNIEQTYEVYRLLNDSLSSKLLSIIGIDMGKTTADNILFPTRGYNISLKLEEANTVPYLVTRLYGDEYKGALFYKVVWNSSFYAALDNQRTSIVGAKFKVGHLQAYYGDYSGIPLNRTFYAGGSNSIRGWRSNDPDLVPEGTPTVMGLIAGPNVKGGTFLLEGSLEYRLRFLENIGTAIFFDYGNTWLGYKNFRFDEVAIATGFGLRYYTEVAPFRIDFGFKFYDPKNKKFLWENWNEHFLQNIEFHFGIGEAF